VPDVVRLRGDLEQRLRRELGARPRRTWHLDAWYAGGRMFCVFDGDDLVGKWPPDRVTELRVEGLASEPFLADDEQSAKWWRVPLTRLRDVDAAVALAAEAAAYVQSAAGAPVTRRTSSAGKRRSGR
jgi:hypothetical protein